MSLSSASVTSITSTSATTIEMSGQAVRQSLLLFRQLCGSPEKFRELFNHYCGDVFIVTIRQIYIQSATSIVPPLKPLVDKFTQEMLDRKGYVTGKPLTTVTEEVDSKSTLVSVDKSKPTPIFVGQAVLWTPSHLDREMSVTSLVTQLSALLQETPRISPTKPFVLVSFVLESSFEAFTELFSRINLEKYHHFIVTSKISTSSLVDIFNMFDLVSP